MMKLSDSFLNNRQRKRRTIRLREYDYSTPWWYYVTICTFERKYFFGEIKDGKVILNKIGKIVEDEWLKTKQVRKNVDLDYYVIMPNHLHGILIIESRGELNSPEEGEKGRIQYALTNNKLISPSQNLGAIIRGFKSSVTKRIRDLSGNSKIKIWQRNYYEHIIRNDNDLYRIRTYIQNNHLKWELDEYYLPHGLK